MQTTEEKVRAIRTQLHLAMNGVTSTSMREKGVIYRLNFGVPYPEVKQIAAQYEKDADLAGALWKEDIREFKLLATMLQPVETFTMEQAVQWVAAIPYQEIAESAAKNLFSRLPFAEDLTLTLIFNVKDEYARTVAFLIWGEVFKEGKTFIPPAIAAFLVEGMRTLSWSGLMASYNERLAAVNAMKFYGRQSAANARQILAGFEALPGFESRSSLQEIYKILKFEFDYYLDPEQKQ